MQNRLSKFLIVLAITALLAVSLAGAVDAQGIRQFAEWIVAKRLTVENLTTLNGDLDVAGDTTMAGDLTVAGDLAADGLSLGGDIGLDNAELTGDLTVGGNLAVTGTTALVGNASAAGTFTVNGTDLIVAKMLAIAPQTEISVTEGEAFTPTGTFQFLESGGDVTPTITAGSNGDVVTLINYANTSITLEDTTGQHLNGNAVLAQYDAITLIFYGTNWFEVNRAIRSVE